MLETVDSISYINQEPPRSLPGAAHAGGSVERREDEPSVLEKKGWLELRDTTAKDTDPRRRTQPNDANDPGGILVKKRERKGEGTGPSGHLKCDPRDSRPSTSLSTETLSPL